MPLFHDFPKHSGQIHAPVLAEWLSHCALAASREHDFFSHLGFISPPRDHEVTHG